MMEGPTSTNQTAASQVPEKMPVRRVGSLTLGICLVGYGILFLANKLFSISYEFIFQLWPVLFILLGLEVLTGSIFHKNEKIRLDFFACLMIFLAICFAMCLACVDYAIQHGYVHFGW